MKDFLKHIWDRKGKLIFLLFVSVFSGLVLYTIFSDDTTSFGLRLGTSVFLSVLELLSFYQVWREYKGYEGLFGRK
jgi:uncharacterized membrane protein YobD (UPF0266 family)